ncbi:MAG TPA: DUF928 domain-containing protein [Oscillatoriales cyanobacterium M59_W2019_021]|nr:MAG: DUF928 domain-containing protein [Cyanobacteria bacterium J055]HIK32411.1 DUF928 domain-containing protein [Oscillatoriales cyanobacterium M4454_W2019_049]HIK52867.1 DUF928 domain-containing protein [Oscillatoriales cyanobacterium M59_W2019_021]
MMTSYKFISKTFTVVTLASTIAIGSSLSASAGARIQFNAPNDPAPTDTTGGGIRGNIRFQAPDDAALDTSTGGGIRGNVQFQAPGDAPADSTGGGIRGEEGFLPPEDAAPQTSTGSGTRGELMTEIVPLVPPAKYGRTIAPRPTVLVYVPPTPTPQKAFFSVQDEHRQNLYETTIELSGEGGIIRITLPEDAPELELNKTYTWFFAPMPADGFLRPDNYGVVGWVKRVEPPAEMETAANSIDRAVAYAASGVWYDTLNTIATAQQADPNDPTLTTEWNDLLEQVGLEPLATQPLTRSF